MLLIISNWDRANQEWGYRVLNVRFFKISLRVKTSFFYKLYRILKLYKVHYSKVHRVHSGILVLIITNKYLSYIVLLFNCIKLTVKKTVPGVSHMLMFLVTRLYQELIILVFICHYYRGQRTRILEDWAKKRMLRRRMRVATAQDQILINHTELLDWGKGRALDKHEIVKVINGDGINPKTGAGNDAKCMRQFLSRVTPATVQNPGVTSWEQFIPESAPLVDYLVPTMESRDDGWKFPNITLLKKLQYARAPSYDILQEYEVREIVVGESPAHKINKFKDWALTLIERL